MSADQLIRTIRDNGGSLRLTDGRLMLGNRADLPSSIPKDLREEKTAVVAILEAEADTERRRAGRYALDALNRAGVGLPTLPDVGRVVAIPRRHWSPAIAEALSRLGYSTLPVVLFDEHHRGASLDTLAARLRQAGEMPS